MTITPIVVTLDQPVTHGKETYKEVVFTRGPVVKDALASDAVQGDARKVVAMYASLSGLPIQVFYEMSIPDFEKVKAGADALVGESPAPKSAEAV